MTPTKKKSGVKKCFRLRESIDVMIHKFFTYMEKSSALSIKAIIIIHNTFFTFEGPLLYRGKYPASVVEQVNYVAHN